LQGESIFFIRSTDVEKADERSGILTLLSGLQLCYRNGGSRLPEEAVLQDVHSDSPGLSTDLGGILGHACVLFWQISDSCPRAFGH